MVRPRGRVVLVGMPGRVHVDLAPLWHREVPSSAPTPTAPSTLPGRAGPVAPSTWPSTVVAALRTGRLVSATYPLDRFEEAIAHAGAAGRRGAVKIAFDLRRASAGKGRCR